jgi:superfamily II DNA or RNA helicase
VIFTSVIERWQHGRMIVMAHRDELIGQAKDKIQRFTGIECDVEMGDARADQCGFYQRAPVLVTSVQTMSRPRRMERFHPEDFGLLIIDEAHHATASTYQAVINYYRQNPALKVLGVTATPDRADETALGQVFKTVAYEYQIVQAIDDGWLVPIEQQFVQVEGLDLSEIKTTAGDLNQGQLAAVLEQEKVLHGYAWPTIELSQGEQTLMFTASVDQAEKMADIFNRHTSGSAEWICGDAVKCPMDHRREVLKRFSNGDFQFLVNCGVLLEGYDEPRIKCVAVARPTKSRSLYAQIIGRGTRPLSGLVDGLGDPIARRSAIATSEKPSLLVLDFVGNSGRHKLIHTGNILGGNYPDDVVAEATRAVQGKSTKGERADMLAELRAAEERKREAARKRAQVAVKAKFQSARIDPFALWDILPKREPGWFKGKKPTQKQLDFLAKAGVPTDDLSFCQASQIIDKAIDRRKKNLCTFKQSKLLAKHGFPTEVTFTEASAIIDRIAKSGWKLMYRPGD